VNLQVFLQRKLKSSKLQKMMLVNRRLLAGIPVVKPADVANVGLEQV